MDHCICLLLQLLLEIVRERAIVELPHQCEFLHFEAVCRAILVYAAVDQARNHRNFICVMLIRSCSLEAERQACHRRRLLVQIVNSDLYVLWISDDAFLLTPGCLEGSDVLDLLDAFDGQPALPLDASLQYEQFKHALVGAK